MPPVKQSSRLYSSSLSTSRVIRSGLTMTSVGAELDEVEAAERRRVLVLEAALDAEVLALDRVGELGRSRSRSAACHGAPASRPTRATIIAEDEPRPEPGGASVCRNRSKPSRESAASFWIAALIRSSWSPSRRGLLGGERGDHAEVERLDADLAVVARAQRALGVAVDRRAQHQAALLGGIGRRRRCRRRRS